MRNALAFAAGWIGATIFAFSVSHMVSAKAAIVSSGVAIALFFVLGVAYARFAGMPATGLREGPAGSPGSDEPDAISGPVVEAPAPSVSQRCEAYGAAHGLTPRQGEVLRLLVESMTLEQVADELYLSKETVKSHAKAVYAKAGVHSRQELVAAVYEHEA